MNEVERKNDWRNDDRMKYQIGYITSINEKNTQRAKVSISSLITLYKGSSFNNFNSFNRSSSFPF